MEIRAIIFDMDGVIFDSEIHSLNCFRKACEKTGLEFDETWFYSLIGQVHNDYVRRTTDKYGPAGFELLDSAYNEFFINGYLNGEVSLKAGAYELITYLKRHGFPVCLATSSDRIQVSRSFDNSLFKSNPFEHAVTGDAGAKSKPDPDVFLRAARELNVPIENCLVIEDSFNGIRAAINANSISCMVPDLLQPDEFIRKHATYIKKDLFEVMDLVKPFVSPLEVCS